MQPPPSLCFVSGRWKEAGQLGDSSLILIDDVVELCVFVCVCVCVWPAFVVRVLAIVSLVVLCYVG